MKFKTKIIHLVGAVTTLSFLVGYMSVAQKSMPKSSDAYNTYESKTKEIFVQPGSSDQKVRQQIMSPDEFIKFKLRPKEFQKYKYDVPCVPNNKDQEIEGNGLYYIKIHKTGSTTMAGVTKRIAKNHGNNTFTCMYRNDHNAGYYYHGLKNRSKNRQKSFVFTLVRDPTSRALSDYFYTSVTQQGSKVEVELFKMRCCRKRFRLLGQAGHQVGFMSVEEKLDEYYFWNHTDPEKINQPEMLLNRIDNLFNSYDFIGVSERMNESLVLLSFLLDLSLADIVYHSSRNGSKEYVQGGGLNNQKCFKTVTKREGMTKELQEYVESNEWKARTAADRLLHSTVIEAMDNTIDNVIGRKEFERRLIEFEKLLEAFSECEDDCSDCSSEGQFISNWFKCESCNERVLNSWKSEA